MARILYYAIYIFTATFPADFKWSSAGPPHGYNCIQILETADPHTWNDNFFCWKNTKEDPGMKWSSAGPIANMKCTKIYEDSDTQGTWHDNFLCVPNDSPYKFVWSQHNPVTNRCIQWLESADPNTWSDNYLCHQ